MKHSLCHLHQWNKMMSCACFLPLKRTCTCLNKTRPWEWMDGEWADIWEMWDCVIGFSPQALVDHLMAPLSSFVFLDSPVRKCSTPPQTRPQCHQREMVVSANVYISIFRQWWPWCWLLAGNGLPHNKSMLLPPFYRHDQIIIQVVRGISNKRPVLFFVLAANVNLFLRVTC